ncbi:hypothetical protein PAQ31011_00642 [Pandoraea aquatica]|uniref:Uncharacterized protein n=1 Tax=Pandoraea aquatica TaxID=2508290 RepID=A0A5E4S950_9BURK|nr:hypothetical protein PAQ31011_00642 [Pandoraea aquatica]
MVKILILLTSLGGLMYVYRFQRLRDRNLYIPEMSAGQRRRWDIRFWTPYVPLVVSCLAWQVFNH